MHLLGEITLNISLLAYLFWFVPQLLLNSKRKSTEGLSLLMHGMLFMGYAADLLYSFGRHMEWQYRLVTVVGLLCLLIQHIQIARYGLKTINEQRRFWIISLLFLSLLLFVFFNLEIQIHGKDFYDYAGMISTFCWFGYAFPQIFKNMQLKSTRGLSKKFVILSLITTVCDNLSAWALGWDYPSKIGLPLSLFKKSVLLYQFYYYHPSREKEVVGDFIQN